MPIGKRQRYHLEPPCGLMNDPNGLACYNGKYYAFFQWNRFAKDHTSKEWGWFESDDLTRWTFRGTALMPDQLYDRDGVLSGSAAAGDEGLYLYYTGKVKVNGQRRSHQCVALMRDGRHIIKLGPVVGTPAACTEHFRDPNVRRLRSGAFLMVLGGQRAADGKGSVFAYRSTDGRHFTPAGELASSDAYEMIECPELLDLGGRHVLLYCPQRRDNARDVCGESFSVYKPVRLDEATMTLPAAEDRNLDQGYVRMDAGFDFYAPQTMACPDGRHLLFAWMSRMEEPQERVFSAGDPYIHCLTMPRELSWQGGRLIQRPARELCQLMGAPVPCKAAAVEDLAVSAAALAERGLPGLTDEKDAQGEKSLPGPAGEKRPAPAGAPASALIARPRTRSWRAQLRLSADDAPHELRVGVNGDALIAYDGAAGRLALTRESLDQTGPESRSIALPALIDLDIWSDTSSVEVFVNGGEAVLSARIAPGAGEPCALIAGAPDSAEISVSEIADR